MNTKLLGREILTEIKIAESSSTCTIFAGARPDTADIAFYSERCDHDWVRSYLHPYLVPQKTCGAGAVRRIYFSTVEDRILRVILKHWNDAGQELLVPAADQQISLRRLKVAGRDVFLQTIDGGIYQIVAFRGRDVVLLAPKARGVEVPYLAVRALRNLMILESLEQGDLLLHASGVVHREKGYLFTGDKFAGKTTTMLAFLVGLQCDFLTNDQALVSCDGSRVWGVPISVGIRGNTLELFPKLKQYVQTHQLSYYIGPVPEKKAQGRPLWSVETPAGDEMRTTFTMKELAGACGVSVASSAPLSCIFLLNRDLTCRRSEASTLSCREAQEQLNRHLLHQVCNLQPCWEYLRNRPVASAEEIEHLAQHVKVVIVRLNSNDDTGELFDRLIRSDCEE